ncbi:hypothetical protein CAEBREN_14847 [Caenorhabditis brenneri]|uniref:GATA-type domain-containing protein n=1 Tax=Caenorhabditis brenneri TaxID=135651 RepID=G0MDF3_CAEBE|nr:hypothetical protein CAEBREN_14847 [Caenorhabditis brenneri]
MPPPIPAAPSTPAPPAPEVKSEPAPPTVPRIKKELIEDVPRTCSNCQTTGSSNWRNVNSKDNIMCHKCFIYRKVNKKDRPTSKPVMKEVKKEMKTIKTE